MRRALALALALLAPGCSLFEGYPDLREERGALCTNGLDDDLDGHADCEEALCASPRCDETGERCHDGWDDDLDGLADARDPGCWAEARFDVERCVPVGPAAFAPVVAPGRLDTGWRQLQGDSPAIETDPLDATRSVLRTVGPTALVSGALGGGVEGLVLDFTFQPAPGGTTAVGLTRNAAVPDFAPQGLVVFADARGVFLAAESQLWQLGPGGPATGRIHVRIEFVARRAPDGTRLRPGMHVRRDGVDVDTSYVFFGAAGPGEVPASIEDGVAYFATFVTDAPGAVLADYQLTLPAASPCITDGTDPTAPLLQHPVLGLARGGGVTCVITRASFSTDPPFRVVSHRSTDDGLHFETSGTVLNLQTDGPSSIAGSPTNVSLVPLAYDGTAFVGVAMIQNRMGGSVRATRLVRSEHCDTTWTVGESGLDHALSSQGLGGFQAYTVGTVDGVRMHEIHFVDFTNLSSSVVVRATSPDGAFGSFTFAPEAIPLPQPPLWAANLPNLVTVRRVAGQRVLVYAENEAVRAYVEQPPGTWTLLERPLFEVSHQAGAFDADRIVQPQLFFDPVEGAGGLSGARLTGLIGYGGAFGGVCPECDVVSMVEPFEVVAR